MNSVNWKDVLIRTVKTFVAAALPLLSTVPSLVASGEFDTLPTLAAAAGLAGAAAVITFVWNTLLQWTEAE